MLPFPLLETMTLVSVSFRERQNVGFLTIISNVRTACWAQSREEGKKTPTPDIAVVHEFSS